MSIITLIETAPLMGLSYRQAPRILNVLEGGFLEDLNRRFAIAPPEAQDAHVKISKRVDLRTIFCFESLRTVIDDWVVRYANRYYQLKQ